MQKKAIRITTGANYNDHTEPLFKQLKLLTLKDVHKIKVAKFMFSASKGILPSPLIGISLVGNWTPRAPPGQSNDAYFFRLIIMSRKQILMLTG